MMERDFRRYWTAGCGLTGPHEVGTMDGILSGAKMERRRRIECWHSDLARARSFTCAVNGDQNGDHLRFA